MKCCTDVEWSFARPFSWDSVSDMPRVWKINMAVGLMALECYFLSKVGRHPCGFPCLLQSFSEPSLYPSRLQ